MPSTAPYSTYWSFNCHYTSNRHQKAANRRHSAKLIGSLASPPPTDNEETGTGTIQDTPQGQKSRPNRSPKNCPTQLFIPSTHPSDKGQHLVAATTLSQTSTTPIHHRLRHCHHQSPRNLSTIAHFRLPTRLHDSRLHLPPPHFPSCHSQWLINALFVSKTSRQSHQGPHSYPQQLMHRQSPRWRLLKRQKRTAPAAMTTANRQTTRTTIL